MYIYILSNTKNNLLNLVSESEEITGQPPIIVDMM